MNTALYKYITHKSFYAICSLFLLLLTNLTFAEGTLNSASAIKIIGNKISKNPIVYKNVTLDLTKGRLIGNESSSIDIEDSTLYITISPDNPYFVMLTSGVLTLKNNRIIVTTDKIPQTINDQALYYLIQINQGTAVINNNTFEIDKFYTVGFLITNENIKTTNLSITNNIIRNFHGGIYLLNSDSAYVFNNKFNNVSFANLFNIGNGSRIEENFFKFPGNLQVGDGIDFLNSNNIVCINNSVLSSASYGITSVASQNILITNNKITDSRSHGIYITTAITPEIKKDEVLSKLYARYGVKNLVNTNITILDNYLSQNRFGIAADNVNGLTITYNTFIQRFNDDASRVFWTNTDNVLTSITNLSWDKNLYKEAYTQEVPGDNIKSSKFISYPKSTGIIIE